MIYGLTRLAIFAALITRAVAPPPPEERAAAPVMIPLTEPPTCTNPVVRKEWRALPREDRAEWIRAVKCLANLPGDPGIEATVYPTKPPYHLPPRNYSGSYYDDLSFVHMDLSTFTHNMGIWLPWHRSLLYGFEMQMKEKCGYRGVSPYWDWTKDAPDFEFGSIWDDDPESGLGGWGDPENDYAITTGGFATNFTLSYPIPHPMRRKFTLRPYVGQDPTIYPEPELAANATITGELMDNLVKGYKGAYREMSVYFDRIEGPRTAVHRMIGGDSAGQCPAAAPNCTTNPAMTPNDPVFWLIHEMMSKVWWDWQNYDLENNFWAFEANTTTDVNSTDAPLGHDLDFVMPLDGFFPEVRVRDVMNITGGYLCYVYE
ncbi:hypothetical protein PLICRDRAFT_113415 [Plicaturopsis crispa FD-325 SS-3]|nr:hypothetical protein PLICRDRAFT_113415 [Plicaturopsis crispa FD-325 SS-3]